MWCHKITPVHEITPSACAHSGCLHVTEKALGHNGAWLLRVLVHFTEKSFHRKKNYRTLFDRIAVWLNSIRSNTIWPKGHLTERQFDRDTIWPNTVLPNAVWPKGHLTELPFDQTPFNRKIIFPKGHLTEKNRYMAIWANQLSPKNFILPK
jgi:hypothetical protein